jgi:hypothetical protein
MGLLLGKVVAIIVLGITLLGGVLFFASRKHQVVSTQSLAVFGDFVAAAPQASPAPSVAAASSGSPTSPQLGSVSTASSSRTDRTDARSGTLRHPRDSLSEEVAILSRAETELHSGRPENALSLLNEHERKFSNGILAEERIAARVQALCALGRNTEADAQLVHLSPKSLHGQRARQACGSRKSD